MSKIDIFQERYECHVAWLDEGEEGGWVGQDHKTPLATLKERLERVKNKRDIEEYEYLFVEMAARDWVKGNEEGVSTGAAGYGYAFEARAKAKRFLAAMRAAMKVARAEYETGVPWPEWAKQAVAAGWKPPKAWKP